MEGPRDGSSERDKGKGKALALTNTHYANASSSKAKGKHRGKVAKTVKPTYSDYRKALKTITMIPTKYPDHALLVALGILEDVEALFHNMGMAKFFTMERPTYKTPTEQFFASLTVHHGDTSPTTPENFNHIEFRVGVKNYPVSFHDICGIYGFKEWLNSYFRDNNEVDRICDMLGDGNYVAGGIKASSLRNPTLRYAHKVLSHIIFARTCDKGM